jgi:hypothetical protein
VHKSNVVKDSVVLFKYKFFLIMVPMRQYICVVGTWHNKFDFF